MTEKEKMLKNILYNANFDEELLKEREAAKDLCYEFNQLRPSNVKKQKEILSKLLGEIKGKRPSSRLSTAITDITLLWGKTSLPITIPSFWMVGRSPSVTMSL